MPFLRNERRYATSLGGYSVLQALSVHARFGSVLDECLEPLSMDGARSTLHRHLQCDQATEH